MVVGANSMPIGIPNLECGGKGNYSVQKSQLWYSTAVRTARPWNSSIVLQLIYETARLQGSPDSALPCFALLALLCSALARCLWCFSSSQENTGSSLQWKGKVYSPSQREADIYIEKSLSRPWLSHTHANEGYKSSLFDWFKKQSTVLIGQKGALWLVDEDADGDVAAQLQLDEESLSHIGRNIIPGTPF